MTDRLVIRPAAMSDAEAIGEIYNWAVAETTASFDTEPRSPQAQRDWLADRGPRHPVLAAELDGRVVGWASLGRWSDRRAYDLTAEESVYVHPHFQHRGIGRRLLAAIVAAGRQAGLRTLIARITSDNPVSVRLHEAAGFEHIGVMRQCGRKFDRWLDVVMMQIVFDSITGPSQLPGVR